jgi:hypothetical protein
MPSRAHAVIKDFRLGTGDAGQSGFAFTFVRIVAKTIRGRRLRARTSARSGGTSAAG